jgi:protein involved in polysaccharide export with SLBB domain
MRNEHSMTAAALCAVLLAVAAVPVTSQQVPPSPEAQQPAATAVPNNALQPGDIIQLRIWREPDWSGQYSVDKQGAVVLPRLGRIKVSDESLEAVRDKLLAEYGRYMRNPSMEIVFLRRVTVFGAVRTPGLYFIDQTLTIADVIAMAGGPTPEGRTDRIEIVRDGSRIATHVSEATRIVDSPIRAGDQLYVPERHWVARNTALTATMISGIISLAVAILLR